MFPHPIFYKSYRKYPFNTNIIVANYKESSTYDLSLIVIKENKSTIYCSVDVAGLELCLHRHRNTHCPNQFNTFMPLLSAANTEYRWMCGIYSSNHGWVDIYCTGESKCPREGAACVPWGRKQNGTAENQSWSHTFYHHHHVAVVVVVRGYGAVMTNKLIKLNKKKQDLYGSSE